MCRGGSLKSTEGEKCGEKSRRLVLASRQMVRSFAGRQSDRSVSCDRRRRPLAIKRDVQLNYHSCDESVDLHFSLLSFSDKSINRP
jgi:hypothetical protein